MKHWQTNSLKELGILSKEEAKRRAVETLRAIRAEYPDAPPQVLNLLEGDGGFRGLFSPDTPEDALYVALLSGVAGLKVAERLTEAQLLEAANGKTDQ